MTKILLSAAILTVLSLGAVEAHQGGVIGTAGSGIAVVHAINPIACAPGNFSATVNTVQIDAMHPSGRVMGH